MEMRDFIAGLDARAMVGEIERIGALTAHELDAIRGWFEQGADEEVDGGRQHSDRLD